MKIKKGDKGNNKNSKRGFAGIASNMGIIASNVAEKSQEIILNSVDKNEDGKIGLDDFGIEKEDIVAAKEKAMKLTDETREGAKSLIHKVSENAKHSVSLLDKTLSESKYERDKKNLRPVFFENLFSPSTAKQFGVIAKGDEIQKMIRIVQRDKKREENIVSRGSIGYWKTIKELDVLNLYEDVTKDTQIIFYPSVEQAVYYVHPFHKNLYINLEEYFKYMKKERVSELEMIASELGATKVTITLKEFKSNLSSKNRKAKLQHPKVGAASGSYGSTSSDYMNMEIATDLTFVGHDNPRIPKLLYFKGERDIEQLIKLRTGSDKDNKLISKTYSLQYNKSSSINQNTAGQIDAALKSMKFNFSISNEVQKESRTILEYHIEFK